MVKSPSRKKYKCVYGTNQYGCCNKKPSVRKSKRCLEASKRRRSPCKYGVDENGCCNKRPSVKYRKSCRKSRRIRKSIESRIKLEKMLNDKHLIKKIIKSLTKSKRKSRKPQHVNRPNNQANFGVLNLIKKSKEIIKKRRDRQKKKREDKMYKERYKHIVNSSTRSEAEIRHTMKQNIERRKKTEYIIQLSSTSIKDLYEKYKENKNRFVQEVEKYKNQLLNSNISLGPILLEEVKTHIFQVNSFYLNKIK
jgi:hypothetical protein